MATNYQRGRAFEYRTRDRLLKAGAVYVMRAAQSKGKVDLLALWPCPTCTKYEPRPEPWLVQCKRDGRLSKIERAELIEIAEKTASVPVLAKTGPKGRGIEFIILTKETP